jgi:PAS domain S-box-containing protein
MSAVVYPGEEQLSQLLIDGVEDYAIFLLDPYGEILTWNTGAARLMGYTRDEAIGKHFSMFYPPDDCAAGKPQELLAAASEQGHAAHEGWHLRKDATRFWADASLTAVVGADGSLTGFAKVTRDRTERRTYEEHIRRLNRLYVLLSDINQTIVRMRRLDELFPAACRIAVEKGGFSLAWIGILEPGTQRLRLEGSAGATPQLLAALAKVIDAGLPEGSPAQQALDTAQPAVVGDIKALPPATTWLQLAHRSEYRSSAAFPLLVDGQAIGVFELYSLEPAFFDGEQYGLLLELALNLAFAAAVDRADQQRRRAEQELRTLNADLEERVRERTLELEERHRELETFTYSVSHDLKAPLRGIDGYGRLLQEDYADRLDEEGRRFLATIRRATQQMSQLIEDLLAYSRLERRKLQVSAVSPAVLVAALLAEYADEIRRRDVAVTVNLPPVTLKIDPEGLAMVLRNLLDNAFKFTQATAEPRIEVGGAIERSTRNLCRLWVRDNGVGFDMKYHDRIFEIFQRLHREEEYPGTGVGLAIVRKALERMGGRVWANSEPGLGTTFCIELPYGGNEER